MSRRGRKLKSAGQVTGSQAASLRANWFRWLFVQRLSSSLVLCLVVLVVVVFAAVFLSSLARREDNFPRLKRLPTPAFFLVNNVFRLSNSYSIDTANLPLLLPYLSVYLSLFISFPQTVVSAFGAAALWFHLGPSCSVIFESDSDFDSGSEFEFESKERQKRRFEGEERRQGSRLKVLPFSSALSLLFYFHSNADHTSPHTLSLSLSLQLAE